MKQIFSIALLILILNSCKKADTSPFYTGVIRRQTTDCTSGSGYPFIIKVENSPLYDSIYTSTLPHEYWLLSGGRNIKFRIRGYNDQEELLLCNATVMAPKFYVIYDVSRN